MQIATRILGASFALFFLVSTTICAGGTEKSLEQQIAMAADRCGLEVSGFREGRMSDLPIFDKYSRKIIFFIEQPVDHTDPAAGTFLQKVVLMHCGYENPTLLVTEGYNSRGEAPGYGNELSDLFNANIVEVEHRYFGSSIPFMQNDSSITFDTLDWDYMTAKNEAADLHNVTRLLKEIYKGKWIASGISKGGQTAMFYTAYYPEDIDISVPYVGPVCYAKEDGRHELFLAKRVGTSRDREILMEFQKEFLKRRSGIEPMLERLTKEKGYTYRVCLSKIYDFCVLELPFAFWQWGYTTDIVPDPAHATDQEMFDFLLKISGPEYFAEGSEQDPFFVQAAKELGYYGYDTRPFRGLLVTKNAENYLDSLFLPKQQFKFDKYLYKDINRFLDTTSSKMLFIYGEYDPWSAVMPVGPVKNEKLKDKGRGRNTMFLFIDPKGSHRARIGTLPEKMQKEAVETIRKWLEEE